MNDHEAVMNCTVDGISASDSGKVDVQWSTLSHTHPIVCDSAPCQSHWGGRSGAATLTRRGPVSFEERFNADWYLFVHFLWKSVFW